MTCYKWGSVEFFSSFTKEELKTNLKKILNKRVSKYCRIVIYLENSKGSLIEYESDSFNREEIITHLYDSQMRGYELDIRNGQTVINYLCVRRSKTTWDYFQIYLKSMDMCEDYGLIELVEAIAK